METTLKPTVTTVPTPRFFKRDEEHYLKVDFGTYYYEGVVDKNLFPKDIKDHISCVQDSLKNLSTEFQSTTGEFTKPEVVESNTTYKISVKFNQGFFTYENEISIPMTYVKKEQMEYFNEKFDNLLGKFEGLVDQNQLLRNEIESIKNSMKSNTMSESYEVLVHPTVDETKKDNSPKTKAKTRPTLLYAGTN
jgi:hypothetical protein